MKKLVYACFIGILVSGISVSACTGSETKNLSHGKEIDTNSGGDYATDVTSNNRFRFVGAQIDVINIASDSDMDEEWAYASVRTVSDDYRHTHSSYGSNNTEMRFDLFD